MYPKKVTPFWDPETSFLQHDQLFNSELSTLSHVHEYWTQSLPSHTFRHSKALHVSQSFSSSITREFQKETEKEMGSVTAEYTPADILFLCKILLLFDGQKCLRDTRPIPCWIYISPYFCQTERLLFGQYLLCGSKNVRTSWLLSEKFLLWSSFFLFAFINC